MRPTVRAAAALVLTLSLAAPALAQKQVQLLATISDPTGGEVTSVDAKDVHVFENGQPITVTKVEAVQRVPKVQILLDTGVGMPPESLADIRKALEGLINAIPDGVETTVVTTAPQPRFLEKPTTDKAKLLAAVNRLSPEQGAGHFVESMLEALQRIDKDKPDAAYTLVTVGTTSGDGDARQTDISKIVDLIRSRQTTVYAVVLTKIGGSVSGGAIQQDLTLSIGPGSGGRGEIINVPNRLLTLLPEIGEQMKKNLGPGAKQFRVYTERANPGAPMGGLSMSVDGKAASGVKVERKQ